MANSDPLCAPDDDAVTDGDLHDAVVAWLRHLAEDTGCSDHTIDAYGRDVLSRIIYGGRDSDTSVPVQRAFDWQHGILAYGASLESETTAATLGATNSPAAACSCTAPIT